MEVVMVVEAEVEAAVARVEGGLIWRVEKTCQRRTEVETYPSEALRAELSVKLGLTDRQLQMWFCHRRLKDRKPPPEKRQKKSFSPSAAAGPSGGSADEMILDDADVAKESGSGLSLFGNMDLLQQQQRVVHQVGSAVPRISSELPSMRRFYEPPLAISEQRAIRIFEAQLGEPLREDGPILGMEFDPLPPGAFGAPIGQQKPSGQTYDVKLYESPESKQIKGASRALLEYQFLPEKPSARNDAHERAGPPHYYGPPTDNQNARVPLPIGRLLMRSNEQASSGYSLQSQMPSLLPQQGRQGHHLSPASGEVGIASRVTPLLNVNTDAHYLVQPVNGLSNHIITPDRRIIYDEERLERKRKSEEARIAKEVEAHEKRIKKELEKQDILRRKKEEQMRKEMERQDRERRKEEERLLREKQREEERCQREQRREMERREKFLQKEYIRAEKMRLKEEMRREKEAAKLKAANDRAAARRIAKESTEMIEDERLELMELAALSRGLSSILALDAETLQNLDMFKDKLPEFPPKSANLKRPFRLQPWTDSEENVGCLLMVWRFLINFADVLGLWPFTLDEFTQAFHDCDPRLLGEIHIALLRSIIKDIEDVARTATTAPVANQNPAVMPGGGHPEIVEGGNDGENVVSNLRSGVAAENAVAIMQERGLSNPRRSRHRLTPGTVKFAAFHVLSLEGSKGLSILDVADKIQGKDPVVSKWNVDGEAEDVEKEDAERDQDSESDAADDPDVDDLDGISKLKEATNSSETSRLQDRNCSTYGKETSCSEFMETPTHAHGTSRSSSSLRQSVDERKSNGTSGDPCADVTGIHSQVAVPDQEDTVIDECGYAEPWVQGLTEGEYADLSIEERLSALVALIGVANEGNTIRIALEERLEAANALKKQMWAEAQLDKRRMKEENTEKSTVPGDIKDVLSSTNHAIQLVDLNEQQNEQSYCSDIVSEKNPLMHEFSVGSDNLLLQQSVCAAEKSRSELKALIGYQAEQLIFVELCDGAWRLIDSEEGFDALVSSLDIRGIRESHLHSMLRKIETSFKGTARKNLLSTIHPGHAFKEVKKEVLEIRPKIDSYSSNDDSRKSILCASYSKSPELSVQFSNELEKNVTEENELMDRCKDVEKWMWEECFNSNKLGASNCGRLRTYSISDQSFNFPEHVSQCKGKVSEELDGVTLKFSLPPRVRLLKAQLATIEASILSEALESVWSEEYRRSWGMKLHMASTAEELLQNLTLLETSIKKDFLSANYETTCEILSSRKIIADSLSGPEEISVLPWIPQTTSAVALQLMELDSSIYYTVHEKESCQKDNQAGYFAKGPLRCYSLERAINNVSQAGYLRQDNWVDLVSGRTNLRRGRGRPRGPSRTRGGKSLRKAINSQDEMRRGSTEKYKFEEFPGWKGRPRGRGGRKKGRRSIRRKQKPSKGSGKNVVEKSGMKKSNFGDTPGPQQEEWNLEETPMEVPGGENVSSSGRSEFEDDNSQASADEYDDVSVDDISGVRNGKSRYFTAVDDYKLCGEDGHDDGDDVDENDEYEGDDGDNEQRDFYVDGYFNSDFHEEGNQPTGVEHVRDVLDRGSASSSSSDYSY
ncbi:UNVERIFIED_CONTAM: Homeobox-DDT domain protein RLT2 [Sesamum calycinum]|uniref:Homeobox-DDT domain protein RLT2 n=1 Tax=Sesamum calycinum TaxID=2727403 RepID=A0AAW2M934_9LAMI